MKKTAVLIFFAISLITAEAQTCRQAQSKVPDDNHAYVLINQSGYALYIENVDKKVGTNVRLWERNDSEA